MTIAIAPADTDLALENDFWQAVSGIVDSQGAQERRRIADATRNITKPHYVRRPPPLGRSVDRPGTRRAARTSLRAIQPARKPLSVAKHEPTVAPATPELQPCPCEQPRAAGKHPRPKRRPTATAERRSTQSAGSAQAQQEPPVAPATPELQPRAEPGEQPRGTEKRAHAERQPQWRCRAHRREWWWAAGH